MSWHTIAFAAAPAGWRVVYRDAHDRPGGSAVAVAGWLTQEDPRGIRVVAAVEDGRGVLRPVPDAAYDVVGTKGGFEILGPGEPDPDEWAEL